MTYKEIANRITGVGCPIFSVSWTPKILEIEIARKVVIFLEDRRVLYNPSDLEVPDHCVQSVLKMREFLTQMLFDVEPQSALSTILRTMRSACRKFLDVIQYRQKHDMNRHTMGMMYQFIFDSGIGELRGAIGAQLARLLVMHGIDCEGDLLTILPAPIDES